MKSMDQLTMIDKFELFTRFTNINNFYHPATEWNNRLLKSVLGWCRENDYKYDVEVAKRLIFEWSRPKHVLPNMAEEASTSKPTTELSREARYAIRESACQETVDEYFRLRHNSLDTPHNRRMFEAGFNRGFDRGEEK